VWVSHHPTGDTPTDLRDLAHPLYHLSRYCQYRCTLGVPTLSDILFDTILYACTLFHTFSARCRFVGFFLVSPVILNLLSYMTLVLCFALVLLVEVFFLSPTLMPTFSTIFLWFNVEGRCCF